MRVLSAPWRSRDTLKPITSSLVTALRRGRAAIDRAAFIAGLTVIAFVAALSGCGQTGALYLPGDSAAVETVIPEVAVPGDGDSPVSIPENAGEDDPPEDPEG